MSVFATIAGVMSGGAGKVGAAVSGIRGVLAGCAKTERRRQAAFAVAMIALSAKMAKADGVVTRPEVDAFCRMFAIPPGEERNVNRLYNLAKRDIAGFETYARDVARLFAEDRPMLEDILDGLFEIAKADGAVHERELVYLGRVAELFGYPEDAFSRIQARHVIGQGGDPYLVLAADRSWSFDQLRRQYRRLVAENHPDRVIARGVPEEFVRIANDRVAALNAAWDRIQAMHAPVRA